MLEDIKGMWTQYVFVFNVGTYCSHYKLVIRSILRLNKAYAFIMRLLSVVFVCLSDDNFESHKADYLFLPNFSGV